MSTKEAVQDEAVQDYLNWAFSLILVADPTNPGVCHSETPKKICTNNKDHQCGCEGDACDTQSNTCHNTFPDYSCSTPPCCEDPNKELCDQSSSDKCIKANCTWDAVTSRNCEIAKLKDTLSQKFLSSLSRPIEVCVGKGSWSSSDEKADYMNDMINGITYTLTDTNGTTLKNVKINSFFIKKLPRIDAKYFDNSSQFNRILSITYADTDSSTNNTTQSIYLVKPAPSDSGPLYIALSDPDSHKAKPAWYSIKAQYPKNAWDYITKLSKEAKSGRFYTFLGNSTKYMNLCCSSPDTPPFLSSVCANTYSMYNKEPLSGLPSPQCDRRMRELCAMKSEANNPICACINRPDPSMMGQTLSEYTTKTLKLPDKCTSGTCNVKLSYVPASLRRQICPNICSSIVEVDSDGYSAVEMDDIHVGVECNKKSGDPSLSSMVSTTMSGNGGTKYRDQWVLYVLVAVIVILVILLIFLYTSYKFRDE